MSRTTEAKSPWFLIPGPRGGVGLGLLLAVALAGCRQVEHAPTPSLSPVVVATSRVEAHRSGSLVPRAREARREGRRLERQGSDASVDRYYEAAVFASAALTAASNATTPIDDAELVALRDLYNDGLRDCLLAAQAFGRIDPSSQLVVNTPSGATTVPIAHRGFVWRAGDFGRLCEPTRPGGNPSAHTCNNYPGLGADLVVERPNPNVSDADRYLPRLECFNATAVLRPDLDAWLGTPGARPPADVLELYDPLRVRTVGFAARNWRITADYDAANARAYEHQASRGSFALAGFAFPDVLLDKAKIIMLEPYQPGKTPLLFVHGLLADPFIFNDMMIALQKTPGFVDHFQIWVYRYPTGVPWFRTAAILREQIRQVSATFDPGGVDVGMRNMVLAGYSMGGLLCRLQVSSSGDALWNMAANRPLESLVMSDEARRLAKELFYFEPVSNVRRVIFLATPHGGGSWATGAVGSIATRFVRRSPDTKLLIAQVERDNPGAVQPSLRDLPTSIDTLMAWSPFLETVRRLPITPRATLHTIAGHGLGPPEHARGDLVVPLSSAHLDEAVSEHWVRAYHNSVYYHPDAIAEVQRILGEHQAEVQAGRWESHPVPGPERFQDPGG
ncbi:MAG: hypothetical protein P4L85_27020 [Paludisphaera borealis]|uniref:esterase/lipase family protein n=1 Tax=Paludisphaera borealis TaxID=1387353 RepID=UPI002851078E|nr:hypothetical protein [Paludisphaera borealis]MDR3623034.1 hypothetical protein [Paludisphaera borealis]